jgi:hypothetical protein
MKHERSELPLAGMKRPQAGAKIFLWMSTAAADSTAVSRCRNRAGVDAMILQLGNFGKGL